MGTSARAWEKPQLVVLGHGEPEEVVLTVCKTSSALEDLSEGPQTSRFGCLSTTYNCDTICSTLAMS